MSKNILICGVGGQGTVLAAKVLSQAAISSGEHVLSAETIELSKLLSIGEDRAHELFHSSETCRLMSDPKYGLHLMSDGYIMDDLLAELRGQPGAPLSNSNSNSNKPL